MRSSVPSFRLGPWEQDREALILVAEEETRKSIGGGREAGGEETATRFIPASLCVGSDPEPALDKLLIYQADSASCKHSYYHDLALSPKTLGHTQTSIWPSDPATNRRKLEKEEQGGGEEAKVSQGVKLDPAKSLGGGGWRLETHRQPPGEIGEKLR